MADEPSPGSDDVRDRARRAVARSAISHLLEDPRPSGAKLRRIAELAELLYDVEAALIWWGRAAEAGDPDAQDMLELLIEERDNKQPPETNEDT